jgi:hypothetical protein
MAEISIRASTTGLSEAAAGVEKLDHKLKIVSNSSAENAKAHAEAAKELEKLVTRLNPAAAAAARFAKDQETLNTAFRRGLLDQKQLEEQAHKLNDEYEKSQTKVGQLAARYISWGAAIGAVVIGAKMITAAAIEGEDADKRLEAQLRITGNAAGFTATQLKKRADEMQNTTRFDDESIKGAMSAMLLFGKVSGDTFERAIRSSADLATVMGSDVRTAAMSLGRALEDPAKGLDTLQRQTRMFDEATREKIRTLAESGKVLEAQALILKTVEDRTKGLAAEMRDTMGGSIEATRNQWNEMLETMGRSDAWTFAVNSANALARGLMNVVEWAGKLGGSATDGVLDIYKSIANFGSRLGGGKDIFETSESKAEKEARAQQAAKLKAEMDRIAMNGPKTGEFAFDPAILEKHTDAILKQTEKNVAAQKKAADQIRDAQLKSNAEYYVAQEKAREEADAAQNKAYFDRVKRAKETDKAVLDSAIAAMLAEEKALEAKGDRERKAHFDRVKEAEKAAAQIDSIFGKASLDVGSMFKDAHQTMTGNISEFLKGHQSLATSVGNIWKRVPDMFIEEFARIMSRSVLSPIMKPVEGFMKEVWKDIADSMKPAFADAWSFVKQGFMALWQWLKSLDWGSSINASSLMSNLTGGGGGIGSIFGGGGIGGGGIFGGGGGIGGGVGGLGVSGLGAATAMGVGGIIASKMIPSLLGHDKPTFNLWETNPEAARQQAYEGMNPMLKNQGWIPDHWAGNGRAVVYRNVNTGETRDAINSWKVTDYGPVGVGNTVNFGPNGVPFATGGEGVYTRPTLIKVGETEAERVTVSRLSGGERKGGTTLNVNGPLVTDYFTMRQFVRRLEKVQ